MNIDYSLDMIRLRVEIPVKALEKIVLKPFQSESNVKYSMKTSITSYRHNFYIEGYNSFGSKCSYWVGSSHNSRKHSDHTDIVLEFNPNKCNGEYILEYLLNNVFRNNRYVEVKSLDVAIDIPINILDLNISQSGNMNRRLFDNGSDDKTYYFRKSKSNGAIRIYNKKREARLNHELTRYEITLNPNMLISDMSLYSIPKDLFISVYDISNFQIPVNLNGTDKILLLACMEHMEYLKELGRDKRKKIEQLLAENCSICFDFKVINQLIYDYMKTIYTL